MPTMWMTMKDILNDVQGNGKKPRTDWKYPTLNIITGNSRCMCQDISKSFSPLLFLNERHSVAQNGAVQVV